MKFSTEAMKQIERIIVADFATQIEAENIKAGELEGALRRNFQEIAKSSYGKMLSLLDEHNHGVRSHLPMWRKRQTYLKARGTRLECFWLVRLSSFVL